MGRRKGKEKDGKRGTCVGTHSFSPFTAVWSGSAKTVSLHAFSNVVVVTFLLSLSLITCLHCEMEMDDRETLHACGVVVVVGMAF